MVAEEPVVEADGDIDGGRTWPFGEWPAKRRLAASGDATSGFLVGVGGGWTVMAV